MNSQRLLVFGGSRFMGRKLVSLLLDEGHHVTLANRGQTNDPFGGKVERLVIDRWNEDSMEKGLSASPRYDLVFDHLCYSPIGASFLLRSLKGRIGKLVMVSSVAAYGVLPNQQEPWRETDLDLGKIVHELKQPWHDMTYLESHYEEGKAQAESFLSQHADFPVSRVRVAHVLSGSQDFTKRLQFYVEKILKNEVIEIEAESECAKNSFIHADEAVRLLKWLGFGDTTGSVNACSHQTLTAHELIAFVATVLKKNPQINVLSGVSNRRNGLTPFSQNQNMSMNNGVGTGGGFSFSNLLDWLPEVILQTAREIESSLKLLRN